MYALRSTPGSKVMQSTGQLSMQAWSWWSMQEAAMT
jgi:hypothetical protein